jgi:transposase-like protein
VRRAERALVGVVQEAYVQGVFTRRVEELVQALGMRGIPKSQVSRLSQALDEEVERFRARPLVGPYPYVWLDATYLKVRQDGRVASMAVVIAIGVNGDGHCEVLGLDLGPSEEGVFWLAFLRSLVARGLSGMRLVVSDAHQGLKGSITAVLQGASWQRCRVHFVRNLLALVPKSAAAMVATTIRTVFVQVEADAAREQWRRVADNFRPRYARLADLLDQAEPDVLAYLAFPREHWRQIWSNNPLEMASSKPRAWSATSAVSSRAESPTAPVCAPAWPRSSLGRRCGTPSKSPRRLCRRDDRRGDAADQRRTRLEMHYPCGPIGALERDPLIRAQLRFRPSSSFYRIADHRHWTEPTPDDSCHFHRFRRVAASPEIDRLVEQARQGATLGELALGLKGTEPSSQRSPSRQRACRCASPENTSAAPWCRSWSARMVDRRASEGEARWRGVRFLGMEAVNRSIGRSMVRGTRDPVFRQDLSLLLRPSTRGPGLRVSEHLEARGPQRRRVVRPDSRGGSCGGAWWSADAGGVGGAGGAPPGRAASARPRRSASWPG